MSKMLAVAFLVTILSATITEAQTEKKVKKTLELKIPREGGANAASVAWHPVLKKYYAAMAGNSSFSVGVYDITGKRISPVEQQAFFDVRGLWYNPFTKTLQLNGYNDMGWGEYILDTKGLPKDIKVLYSNMNQPDEQSVGAYDSKEKVVYFFNGEGNIEIYKDGAYSEGIDLTLGKTEDDDAADNDDVLDDYNTSIIYTGINGADIGLLNHLNKEIELYDSKNGHLTRKLILPADAPVSEFLNFAYCNNLYWLFDHTTRTWIGYK